MKSLAAGLAVGFPAELGLNEKRQALRAPLCLASLCT